MSPSERGLVTGVGARSVQVWVEGRGAVRCTLRGHLWAGPREQTRPVTVGDRVAVLVDGEQGVIETVQPRDNVLSRPVPVSRGSRGRTRDRRAAPVQVLAANLDRLVVVAALVDPPFRPGLVDRFLVAAAREGIDALLCLNKVDLPGDRGVVAPYRASGVEVIEVSAVTGEGIETLGTELARGVHVLVGHSGVGKSSLLNAVSPGLALTTGDVTSHHGRGRHTTTASVLLRLATGGWVVDSPGLREFGLEQVPAGDLARLFPGFGDLPDACRFGNCRHRSEPDCAVRAAAEDGTVPAERYASYRRLLEDLEREGR